MNKLRELMNNLRKKKLPWIFLAVYAISIMLFSIFFMPFDMIGWICFCIAVFVGILYCVYLLMPQHQGEAEEQNLSENDKAERGKIAANLKKLEKERAALEELRQMLKEERDAFEQEKNLR